MLIYEALKKDHDVVKGLLNELVNLTPKQSSRRHQLIEQIRDELVPHSRAEEAVFYNSMRLLDASKELAMHGYQEHLEAETYLRALQVQDKIDIAWKNTAQKLKEAIEHHIEEEEGELFTAAKQLFTAQEAEVMADVFQRMKPQIKEEGLAMTTLEMIKNMMPPRLSMAMDDLSLPFIKGAQNRSGRTKHL